MPWSSVFPRAQRLVESSPMEPGGPEVPRRVFHVVTFKRAYKTADKIFKATKSSNLLKFIGPMSRFSSHSRTSLRAEVSFSLTWPLAFAKPFMTVRNLRSQGKFENINFATDSYFIDQYFAKAISTYVPFYSLNLRRLARVELSFELEFFWNETKKKQKNILHLENLNNLDLYTTVMKTFFENQQPIAI